MIDRVLDFNGLGQPIATEVVSGKGIYRKIVDLVKAIISSIADFFYPTFSEQEKNILAAKLEQVQEIPTDQRKSLLCATQPFAHGAEYSAFHAMQKQRRKITPVVVLNPKLKMEEDSAERVSWVRKTERKYGMPGTYFLKNGQMVRPFAALGELYGKLDSLFPKQRKFIAYQLIKQVNACWNDNVCHMDIKPQNVLLRGDFTAHLIDFGMAKLGLNQSVDTDNFGFNMCGTFGYQMKENCTQYRHDQFALGVTLLRLFSPSFRKLDELLNPKTNQDDWHQKVESGRVQFLQEVDCPKARLLIEKLVYVNKGATEKELQQALKELKAKV